ncbi:DUF5667 domain-containing protein [Candidatus Oleimmundimicrobium sp.]|uniref:DUF5667 domain-containing protein n=1 Tax=Candidatus Oleimmundimicrobium sp. TaxID=3060597 RepID=UPI0027171B65|nr:DUF5667 domain-containing protein [Candidatus Oleimmundimicrobium sp.]MDO8885389.1 DUF5667 domain-containing protein [Candidatus Oleimmundimicrobium sp.]
MAKYPKYSQKLKPLLSTFVALKNVPKPKSSAQFKQTARSRLLEQAKLMKRSSFFINFAKPKKFSSAMPVFLQVAAAILIVVLLSGGTVMASASSLPGDLLYPVKIATEEVQLFLTFNKTAKAELHLKFAEKRLNEIKAIDQDEIDVNLDNIVSSMTKHLNKAMNLTNEMQVEERGEALLKILYFIQHEEPLLQQVANKVSSKEGNALKNAIKATLEDNFNNELRFKNSKTLIEIEKEEKKEKEFGETQIETKDNLKNDLSDDNNDGSSSFDLEQKDGANDEDDFEKKIQKR